MTVFQDALQQDIAENIFDATALYEADIQSGFASLDSYINLATLYWVCTDYGFNAGKQLPLDFIGRAWERYDAVLLEAAEKFGHIPEIKFWRLYCAFITLGEPSFDEECEALVAEPGCTLVPYFYLYSFAHKQQYWQQAAELLDVCILLPTFKNNYIQSVIVATAQSANNAAGRRHDKRPRPLGYVG